MLGGVCFEVEAEEGFEGCEVPARRGTFRFLGVDVGGPDDEAAADDDALADLWEGTSARSAGPGGAHLRIMAARKQREERCLRGSCQSRGKNFFASRGYYSRMIPTQKMEFCANVSSARNSAAVGCWSTLQLS